MLDLDDFKLINDRFGHLAGDGVLKAAAGAIRQCTREIDQPARWGGEEFAVILPHTGLDGAARLAERLRQAIAERQIPTPDGRSVRVTASFGVAALPGIRHHAGRADGRRGRRGLPLEACRQEPCLAG